MKPIILDGDSDSIDLRGYFYKPWITSAIVAGAGGRWLNEGCVRWVPNAVLANLLTLYEDYDAMEDGGRITEVPPAVFTIHWSDTQPLPKEGDEGFDGGDAA